MAPKLFVAPDQRELLLETADANPISNVQVHRLSLQDDQDAAEVLVQYGQHVTERAPRSGIYNCHGLVFAARRTTIYDAEVVNMILTDDGYVDVQTMDVLAGDIILYLDDDGDVEHSGIVIEPPNKSLLNIATIVSKWGRGWEVIHAANQCPYNYANHQYKRVKRPHVQ